MVCDAVPVARGRENKMRRPVLTSRRTPAAVAVALNLLLLQDRRRAANAQSIWAISPDCSTDLTTKVTVGSQTETVSSPTAIEQDGVSYISCSDINPGYSGIITLGCTVENAQWGGTLSANASECSCLNPYAVGSDSYFCHKYKYCYQKQGNVVNPMQCRYDCSAVEGWADAVAAWPDADTATAAYDTDFFTRTVNCENVARDAQPSRNCIDGFAVSTVNRVDQPHAGHVATTTWENSPLLAGEVESGGHCLPFEVTDFDECVGEAGNEHTCDPNAVCTNTVGSFTCVCKNAFTGDGYTCTDRPGCLNGRCFIVVTNNDATFDVADSDCQGRYPASASSSREAGHLASVHSLAEQEFIFAIILDGGVLGDYWLGLRQDAEYHPWWWTDGSDFDYAKWIAPDPDNLPDQMCGLTRNNPSNSKHNNWFDLSCESPHPYVCEYFP
eukprot:SAG22_NODE_652_length_8143_cov_2.399552_4_plen_442_part_00